MKVVYVEWMDAVSMAGDAWKDQDKVKDLRPELMKSVGWVASESKSHITLVNSDGCGDFLGEICIPKATITKRRNMSMKK